VWWCLLVISAFKMLRQVGLEVGQPGVHSETVSKKKLKSSMVMRICSLRYLGGRDRGISV
jgi:hypothetical protein